MSSERPPAQQGALCRDCLALFAPASPPTPRCPRCGSPRVLSGINASDLTLAHIDCDAFYASVEKRDNPALADKPLIVGGGGRRGVVSTACYVARTFGVRSAMPTASALKLCPHAIVVPPDMAKYAGVAQEIRSLMFELTPLVEPISIDEAFLDLTGCEGVHGTGAAGTLVKFARRVETEIGVTVSIGLSYCKFLAKLASDMDKPRGFAAIGREEARARLAPLSVDRLWGVGKVAGQRLRSFGFNVIADFQALEQAEAVARLGDEGRRLWRLAHGMDDRRVTTEREVKSISAEITFEHDVGDAAELSQALLGLCERVAKRLKRAELAAGGVTLKLRTPDFKLRTRSRSGLAPTQLAPRLFETARGLLEGQPAGMRYRLIGVAAADLKPGSDADETDLLEGDRRREKARESAIDALRDKFGSTAVVRGLAFRPSAPRRG